jgi:hypothetical protein
MRLFFRVREATIPKEWKDVFEQFGVNVIGSVLGGGYTPGHQAIRPVYNDLAVQDHARKWMKEQHDRSERKENWMFVMEVAITVFVLLELIISILGWVFPSASSGRP